jgi:hypothetical protein
MSIDLAVLSPVSGLLGGLLGAGGTLIAAIYQQRGRKRLQRVAGEVAKREMVYADFVILASNLLLHAYTHDEIELTGDEQRLMGLINRMRFFASPKVVATAEAVLRAIVEIALKPSIEVRQLATQALSARLDDPLREFSLTCKADLDSVRRHTM